jgi:hypothetical protein
MKNNWDYSKYNIWQAKHCSGALIYDTMKQKWSVCKDSEWCYIKLLAEWRMPEMVKKRNHLASKALFGCHDLRYNLTKPKCLERFKMMLH